MTDVDDVWADMRREKVGPALASLGRKTKPAAKKGPKARAKQLDSTMAWTKSWGLQVAAVKTEVAPVLIEAVSEPPETMLDTFLDESVSWTPESFMAAVARDINLLSEDSVQVRLESLQKLARLVSSSLPTDVFDAAIDVLLKPLLKRFADASERNREIACKIVMVLMEGVTDSEISQSLPYLVPVLVSRLQCEDIDGVSHLPEVARPKPEQRPSLHYAIETSEEVRLCLAHVTRALLQRLVPYPNLMVTYIDEVVGVCRAFAMDPFADVKALACENMELLCYHHYEMLLHFTEPLGRSLCSCLTHNHAKIKHLALRALTAVLKCGTWKHNHEVIQLLVAWQDPNLVPVKAFYDPLASTTVNYMSSLTFCQTPSVRRFWFETLAHWILTVTDKVDHEPHIFPYLLSGMFDDNDEIALESFWLMEKLGELYEQEEAKDLKDIQQYGFEYQWTYNGRGFVPFPCCGQWRLRGSANKPLSPYRRKPAGPDHLGTRAEDRAAEVEIDLGDPIALPAGRSYAWPTFRDLEVYPVLPRPRLGARHYVRKHTRRYIKALFNDVVDFRDCTALNAGRLFMVTIAYAEEGCSEWIKEIDDALVRFYSGKAAMGRSPELVEVYDKCLIQLGAFLDPRSYWMQAKLAFSPDSFLGMAERVGTVEILTKQIRGSCLVLASLEDPSVRWGRLEPIIPDILTALMESDLLFEAPSATRKVLWGLVKELLVEELRPYYSAEQVTQLLCLGITIAAEPAPELRADLVAIKLNAGDVLSQEQWADEESLEELLQQLADIPSAPSSEGAGLIGACFQNLLDFADFAAFRGLAGIAAVSVISANSERFFARLKSYILTGDQGTRVLGLGIVRKIVQKSAKDGSDVARQVANAAIACLPPVLTGIQELQTTAVTEEVEGVDMEALDDSPTEIKALDDGPIDLDDIDLDDGVIVEEIQPSSVGTSDGPVIQAVDMDELDGLDDTPGSAINMNELDGDESEAELRRKEMAAYEELKASGATSPLDVEEHTKRVNEIATANPKDGEEAEDDGEEDIEKAPLLIAKTPYVVLISALAVLQQSLRDCPSGFLDVDSSWWVPLVTIVADGALSNRLRNALERAERTSRGYDTKQDFSMNVEKMLREESFKRADRLRCSAAATLTLAGDRSNWPTERVDELRPLFTALKPSEKDANPLFGQVFFVRSLPPALAMHIGTLAHHAVAPKWRGNAAVRDDATRAIARLDISGQPVSRLRGKEWSTEEKRSALEKTVHALMELNLVLPPDSEARNAPAGTSGLVLGQLTDNNLVPSEVEQLLAESDETLRWNAAFVLYEVGIELVRQFTALVPDLEKEWKAEGLQGRVMLLEDLCRKGLIQQREKTSFR
jgi:hypothetical protein